MCVCVCLGGGGAVGVVGFVLVDEKLIDKLINFGMFFSPGCKF